MALLCLTNQGNIFKEIGFKCFMKYLPEQLSRMQKIKNMEYLHLPEFLFYL